MKTRVLAFIFTLLLSLPALGGAGAVDPTFNPGSGIDRSVECIVVAPDGKLIIGGDFATVPGLARNGIARLNADGTGDPTFNPGKGIDGHVTSVALQPDGKVLVGGWFTNVNGITHNRIVRFNSDGSLDSSFNASANNLVFSVALQADGKILLGGYFTTVNGQPQNRIARLNADGTLDTSFYNDPGANDYIYSIIVQPDGKLLVGGLFTWINGVNRNRIARLNSDGSVDFSFDPGAGVSYFGVTSMALQPDGKLLVGGIFQTVNGVTRHNIARLNADGSLDTGFNADVSGEVGTIAPQADGKILIGGQFHHINGVARETFSRLNADGSLDLTFTTVLEGKAEVVAVQPDGQLLVGGAFSHVNGQDQPYMARLNPNGSLDNSFNPHNGVTGYGIYSMKEQPDGKLLIAGFFGEVNSQLRTGIARLNTDGTLDTTFNTGPLSPAAAAYRTFSNSVVYSVALQPDGKIIIGGGFTNINGTARKHITRLNADGTLDPTFNIGSGADANVYDVLLQPDGRIIIAGGFTSINGTPRAQMARLNSNGSLDLSFNANVSLPDSMALQPDGKLIVATYGRIAGTFRYYTARLNTDGTLDPTFEIGRPLGGLLDRVLLLPDGKTMVSGSFTNFNGFPRPNVVRLNANGSLDQTFPLFDFGSTQVTNAVVTTVQSDGKLLVTGEYPGADLQYRPRNLVRLHPNGVRDFTFDAGTGTIGPVYEILLLKNSKIAIGGIFSAFNGEPRSAVARLLGDPVFPPSIGTQPASRTNIVGSAATFTVQASGTATLRYRWFMDGLPLPEGGRVTGTATPTLTLTGVHFADIGNYTVVVTNLHGSVTSAPANLRVITPPHAVIALSPLAKFPGITNLYVIATNGTKTNVKLDGSASEGEDSLQFAWRDGSTLLATTPVTTQPLAVGAHTITLRVNDGPFEHTATANLQVLKPSDAVTVVIGMVQSSNLTPAAKQPLLTTLTAARTAFQKGNLKGGVTQLKTFQFQVQLTLSRTRPGLATQFRQAAQIIITTLE